MSNQLTFNNIQFNVIERDNQIWLSSIEIAQALGYSKTNAVTKIHNQNSDEFTQLMTTIIELPKSGSSVNLKARSRIFSLRGAHLIAMFARTPKAKEFRIWVLDILDRETGNSHTVIKNSEDVKGETLSGKTTTDQRTPLRDAVNMLVGKKGLMYPEAYSFIHQRFNVSSIDDLALEQLPEAIEYIHRLAIDGEFIPSEAGKQRQEMWDLYYMGGIHDYFNFIYEVYKTQIRPALNAVDSPISFRLNDRFSDGSILIGKLKASLEKRAGCDMSQVRELLM